MILQKYKQHISAFKLVMSCPIDFHCKYIKRSVGKVTLEM